MTPNDKYLMLLLVKDELEFLILRMKRLRERAALADDEQFKDRLGRHMDEQVAAYAEELEALDQKLAEAKVRLS
jgi:hypothetical protein